MASYDWTGWTYSADGTNENGRIMTMGLGNPLEPGTYYLGVVNYGYPGDTSSGPMSYTLLSRGIGDSQTISIEDLAYAGGSATNADGFKNIDSRIKELELSEAERKAAQTAFIEQQSVAMIDRERTYKEWKEKFDTVKKQAQTLDTQILALEEHCVPPNARRKPTMNSTQNWNAALTK